MLPSQADTVVAGVVVPSSAATPVLHWTPFTLDSLTRVAAQSERSPVTNRWAHRFRHLGQPEVFLPVVIGLLLGGRVLRRVKLFNAGRRAAIVMILVGLVGTSLKYVVGRVRPNFSASPAEFRPMSGAASFPSGHTGAAFALAGSLALETTPVAGAAFLLGAAGTGWSRINDNKHWLSDVFCGAVLALLIVGLVHRWDRRRAGRGPPPPIAGQ